MTTVWPGRKRRAEHVVQVGQEHLFVGGALHGHGGDQSRRAHRGEDRGVTAPVARRLAVAALALGRVAVARAQRAVGPAFVHEHQVGRVQKQRRLPAPRRAFYRVLLAGAQRLFFRVQPRARTARQSVGTLTRTPSLSGQVLAPLAQAQVGFGLQVLAQRLHVLGQTQKPGPTAALAWLQGLARLPRPHKAAHAGSIQSETPGRRHLTPCLPPRPPPPPARASPPNTLSWRRTYHLLSLIERRCKVKGFGDGVAPALGSGSRLVPFGRYWRKRPLVFSLVPRSPRRGAAWRNKRHARVCSIAL